MKLSDRLKQAKAQRDAGLAPPVNPDEEASLTRLGDGADPPQSGALLPRLRPRSVPVDMSSTSWARQAACPTCDGESEIDLLDLVGGVLKLHCVDCGHAWSVHRPG
jgi:hypothetical protein